MKMNSVIIRNKLAGLSMLASRRSGLFDPNGLQFDGLFRFVVCSARQLRDFRGDVHSFDNLAKDGVLTIKPRCWRHGDEKLATVCAWSGIGHREFSRLVVLQGWMKLVAKAIAGITGTCPEGASALNHELRNHTMEYEAIEKWTLHFLPGLRVLEFLGAFR